MAGTDEIAGGNAGRAVEQAARDSRSRLIAWLAARSRDVAAAQDALSDAGSSAATGFRPVRPRSDEALATRALTHEPACRKYPRLSSGNRR